MYLKTLGISLDKMQTLLTDRLWAFKPLADKHAKVCSIQGKEYRKLDYA